MSQPDMTTWNCSKCKTRRLGWCNPCPVCGCWNTIAKDHVESPPPPPQGRLMFYGDGTTKLETELEAAKRATGLRAVPLSEIPDAEIKRVQSWEPFDEVMAGGFACGTTCLLDGAKGLGKSTLATHVALCWPKPSVYLTAEAGQGPAFVSARAHRIAPATKAPMSVLKIDRIDLDRWDAVHLILAEYSLIILDSLQGFTPNYREQLDLTRLLGKSAEKTGACVLLLSRVNGRGETAGWEELPHQVDACLSLVEHADVHAELVATKNRNGPLARVLLSMGPHGMHKELIVPSEELPSEF